MRSWRSAPFLLAAVAVAALAADPPPLPEAAAKCLAEFRAADWSQRLRPQRPDPAPEVWKARVRAEWELGALDPAHRVTLEALLADEDRFVRALAARSLGVLGDEASSPALVEALVQERDKGTRIALVEALGRTGGAGALEAVEAEQKAGADVDVSFAVGIARRQLKGGRWDLASLRAEHEEARTAPLAAAAVGQPAPEIALPSAAGPVNLSTRRGKVVVLVFSLGDRGDKGTKVLQRLGSQFEQLGRLGAHVVVVAPHEKERTDAWAQRMRLPEGTFTVCSDPAARAQAAYGVARQLFVKGEWMPSPGWFVVDPKGKLVWARVGTRDGDEPSLGDLLPVLDDVSRGIALR